MEVRHKGAHIRNEPEILRPKDVQKTVIGLIQEDLRQLQRIVVPRHTTDRAELAYSLAGTNLLGPLHGFWCDTHAFIEGSRLGTVSTAQGARGCTLFSPIDNLHFGRAIIIVFPMAQLPTSSRGISA